jgi:hypothetical protein
MHWSQFRQKLDPSPTARVGKRWIRDGVIPGRFIDGEPYVDLREWNGDPVDEMVEEMCQ